MNTTSDHDIPSVDRTPSAQICFEEKKNIFDLFTILVLI